MFLLNRFAKEHQQGVAEEHILGAHQSADENEVLEEHSRRNDRRRATVKEIVCCESSKRYQSHQAIFHAELGIGDRIEMTDEKWIVVLKERCVTGSFSEPDMIG